MCHCYKDAQIVLLGLNGYFCLLCRSIVYRVGIEIYQLRMSLRWVKSIQWQICQFLSKYDIGAYYIQKTWYATDYWMSRKGYVALEQRQGQLPR